MRKKNGVQSIKNVLKKTESVQLNKYLALKLINALILTALKVSLSGTWLLMSVKVVHPALFTTLILIPVKMIIDLEILVSVIRISHFGTHSIYAVRLVLKASNGTNRWEFVLQEINHIWAVSHISANLTQHM